MTIQCLLVLLDYCVSGHKILLYVCMHVCMYGNLTVACTQVGWESFPHCGDRSKAHRPMSVWTEWVEPPEPVRVRSIFWHNIWVDNICGRPKNGLVADITRQTIVRQRFAEAILSDRGWNFWTEVRK